MSYLFHMDSTQTYFNYFQIYPPHPALLLKIDTYPSGPKIKDTVTRSYAVSSETRGLSLYYSPRRGEVVLQGIPDIGL